MLRTRPTDPEPILDQKAEVTVKQDVLHTLSQGGSPPPSYSASTSQEPPIDICSAFANLNLNQNATPAQKPTPDQCLAHLKLLEAFHSLREDISQQDGLFGISDDFATADTEQERAQLLAKIREKRWQVYVSKASKRFEAWWETCIMPNAQRQTQSAVMTVTRRPWTGRTVKFERVDLPPLDVVMVWHAYQLNPRNFLEDCILLGKMDAWRTGLPWAVINSCIDNRSFEYDPGTEAEQRFESSTKHCWDSLQDPNSIEIECPACCDLHAVPWTTWYTTSAWCKNGFGIFHGEADATGYADRHFIFTCSSTKKFFHHGALRAQRFRKDLESLKHHATPMQGTCLDDNGLPEVGPGFHSRASFFPNRFLVGGHSAEALYPDICAIADPKSLVPGTMDSVRTEIEKGFANGEYVMTSNGHRPTKEERIALRRMMSCYWDNASPFSLDLVGAVIRQGTFVEKMHRINWIHSPAAKFSMQRLLVKYDRYLSIHTHQLCPPMYFRHTVTLLNRFLNHDDKIEDTVLSNAFEWTSKTYQKMYNELYSECTCWYCEAIRESHASTLSGLNLRKKFGGKAEEQLNQVHSARDPSAEMNHISAHSSIKPTSTDNRYIRERYLKIKLERDYQKAVVKARKQGRDLPARDEYYYAYGYPLYMPVYVPYEGDPCVSEGMYTANPSCASFVPGASGNCAAGSCGGGVAVGACGGGGSCSGGDSGGCGGGYSGCG
ncbi:hypothetical protein BDR22DRAFT_893265 [Usnea florida]